jgi:hypothetical protein
MNIIKLILVELQISGIPIEEKEPFIFSARHTDVCNTSTLHQAESQLSIFQESLIFINIYTTNSK